MTKSRFMRSLQQVRQDVDRGYNRRTHEDENLHPQRGTRLDALLLQCFDSIKMFFVLQPVRVEMRLAGRLRFLCISANHLQLGVYSLLELDPLVFLLALPVVSAVPESIQRLAKLDEKRPDVRLDVFDEFQPARLWLRHTSILDVLAIHDDAFHDGVSEQIEHRNLEPLPLLPFVAQAHHAVVNSFPWTIQRKTKKGKNKIYFLFMVPP